MRDTNTGQFETAKSCTGGEISCCAGCGSEDHVSLVMVDIVELSPNLLGFSRTGFSREFPLCYRCHELVVARQRLSFSTDNLPVIDGRALQMRGVNHQKL